MTAAQFDETHILEASAPCVLLEFRTVVEQEPMKSPMAGERHAVARPSRFPLLTNPIRVLLFL
jgi:hypothetical protein